MIALSKQPLVEAIFEMRWDLAVVDGSLEDPLYDLQLGAVYNKLKDKLPHHIKLGAARVPAAMVPHQVQHQFRATADGWPIVQLGPGVITVNQTSGYRADDFIALCGHVYSKLREFWMENSQQPIINNVSLRYIDADKLGDEAPLDFMKKLGVDLSFQARLLGSIRATPAQFQLKTMFPIPFPAGNLLLSAGKGKVSGEDAIIWETTIVSQDSQCSSFSEAPDRWLAEADKLSHEIFFSMIDGELLEKYK